MSDINTFIFWKISYIIVDPKINFLLLIFMALLFLNQINVLIIIGLWLNLDPNQIINIFSNINFIITPTLTNGFFLLHPCLIFFMYILYILYLINIFYTVITTYILNIYLIKKSQTSIILINTIIAIWFGSWWASQELGWGGWWSWDMVELINLFLLLLLIKVIHENQYIRVIYTLNIKFSFIIIIFFFHTSVRYDIFNSIHSFINSNYIEYINLLIYLIILIFFIIKYNILSKIFVNIQITYFSFFLINFLLKFIYMYSLIQKYDYYVYYFLNFTLSTYIIIIALKLFFKFLIYFNILFNEYILFNVIYILNAMNKINFFYHALILMIIYYKWYYVHIDFLYKFNTLNKYLFINFSDLMLLVYKSINDIFLNSNILENKLYLNNTSIPFYNYTNKLNTFITNNNNYSLYNYYLDIVFYLFVLIIVNLIKNIIQKFYNKYKIWCI